MGSVVGREEVVELVVMTDGDVLVVGGVVWEGVVGEVVEGVGGVVVVGG